MWIAPEPSTISREGYNARPYIPELDGLRAFSILVVVSAHMKDRVWGWLAGNLGVTLFFVLSGYLITLLALREERLSGRLNLRAFFVRRVYRLFPLYYFALGLYALLIFGLGISPEKRANFAAAMPYYLTYLQEWPFFRGIDGSHTNIPYYQSWSLGIEEKFYLVWPFLAFVAWRGSGAFRRGGTAILLILMAASPAILGEDLGRFSYPYSHILGGCLVALLLDDPAWFDRLSPLGRPGLAWMTFGLLFALHFLVPQVPDQSFSVGHSGYTIAASLFLISVVLGGGPIHRLLRRPALVLIGKLSYGIYLIHLIALNVAEKIARPGTGNLAVSTAALVLAWAISIAAAYVLALTIERPGIALGRRLSSAIRRRDGPAGPEAGPLAAR